MASSGPLPPDDAESSIPLLFTAINMEEEQTADNTDCDPKDETQSKAKKRKAVNKKDNERHRNLNQEQKMKPELYQAAEAGNVERVRQLLRSRPEQLAQVSEGNNTPLHLAAKNLHLECCIAILEAAPHLINLTGKGKQTPLLISITAGSLSTKVTELLVNKGASLKSPPKRQNALHKASEYGNFDTVKLLLKHGMKVDAEYADLRTSLHLAAHGGHKMVCEELMKAGANVNVRDTFGLTPLHLAAKKGMTETCRMLLEHGADVNSEDNNGNTPLHMFCAARKDKAECGEVLLHHGANIDAQNSKGQTPLHLAYLHSPVVIAEFLISKYADIELVDEEQQSALHIAASRKNIKHVQSILKSKQCSKDYVNQEDVKGRTALHIALSNELEEASRTLIKAGADGNISYPPYGSALHWAAYKGLESVCNFLLQRGVNVDMKNSNLETPLQVAAEAGHLECCKLFMKKGALVTATDAAGMTALHHAAQQGHSDCCREIVKHNPQLVNWAASCRRTPLHLAVEVQNQERRMDCCEALKIYESDGKRLITDVWMAGPQGSSVKMAFQQDLHTFRLLLHSEGVKGSHLSRWDINFQDTLENALEPKIKNRTLAEIVVESSFWQESLLPADETRRNNNLRLLVRHFPKLAQSVLDKCLPAAEETNEDPVMSEPAGSNCLGAAPRNKDKQPEPPDEQVNNEPRPEDDLSADKGKNNRFFVRFLDEAYPTAADTPAFDHATGRLVKGVRVNTVDAAWRDDHLLQWVMHRRRLPLLRHPLVARWLHYKWNTYIRCVHYIAVSVASLQALLLTLYTIISMDWQYMNVTFNITKAWTCPTDGTEYVGPEVVQYLRDKGQQAHVLGYFIIVLMCAGLAHYGYKVFRLRGKSITTENGMFVVMAVTSFFYVGNYTSCSYLTYVREDWQWLAGVVSVVVAWVHVLCILSIHPWCSPFVFRFRQLFRTLLKVLIPLGAVAVVLVVTYHVAAKGSHGYNKTWNIFVDILSYQWVSTAAFIGVLVVICLVMLDKGRPNKRRKQEDQQIMRQIQMTLNFDLLYPILRRKFYVAWIPLSETGAKTRCFPCLPRKKQEEEFTDTSSDSGHDEDELKYLKKLDIRVSFLSDGINKQSIKMAEMNALMADMKALMNNLKNK